MSTLRTEPAPPGEVAISDYVNELVHQWSSTLTKLGITLVPAFFILDYFILPTEMLTRFAVMRLVPTLIVILQYFFIRYTKPSRLSVLHGYFITLVIGGAIALMTTELGGFNSAYYAGLNLVLVAVTVLLPWEFMHSALNTLFVIALYIGFNLIRPSEDPQEVGAAVNNLFFLCATGIIAVSISYVKQRLVRKEFLARQDLKTARDALWGEMEVAKRIQTSLLPDVQRINGYQVAAIMQPADEVGGDYYDIIETDSGETWISIGDVSGHGVESGLIMMMTQTSIYSTVNRSPGQQPSSVLARVNTVIKQNIWRLGADRYMTISTLLVKPDGIVVAGKHQDILIYRHQERRVEAVPTSGTWIGIVDDLEGLLQDITIPIAPGDVVLLFTDGVTEAANRRGEMFGEERLQHAIERYATLQVRDLVKSIVRDVQDFLDRQDDDITIVAMRRIDADTIATTG